MVPKIKSLEEIRNYIVGSFIFVTAAMLIRLAGYLIFDNYVLFIEAIHMLLDVIITILVIFVIFFVRSERTRKYPYGLYKVEDLTALLMSILILFMTYEISQNIFKSVPSVLLYASIIQFISIIPLFLSGYFKFLASKKIRSPSLKSDAAHMITDVIEGTVIGVGLYLANLFHSLALYYFAFAVAIIALLYVSFHIFRDSIYGILDLPKNKKLIGKIEDLLKKTKEVVEVNSVKLRWAGPVIFAELVLVLNPELNIEDAHRVADKIENELSESISSLESISIHIEPKIRKNFKICAPLTTPSKNSKISERFTESDYFVTVIIEENEVKSIDTSENRFWIEKQEHASAEFAEYLADHGYTDVIAISIGEIVYGILLRHNIKVWKARSEPFMKNLSSFQEGKLIKMTAPTDEASWRNEKS